MIVGRTTTTLVPDVEPPSVATLIVPRAALSGARATMRRTDFDSMGRETPDIVTVSTDPRCLPVMTILPPGVVMAGLTSEMEGGLGRSLSGFVWALVGTAMTRAAKRATKAMNPALRPAWIVDRAAVIIEGMRSTSARQDSLDYREAGSDRGRPGSTPRAWPQSTQRGPESGLERPSRAGPVHRRNKVAVWCGPVGVQPQRSVVRSATRHAIRSLQIAPRPGIDRTCGRSVSSNTTDACPLLLSSVRTETVPVTRIRRISEPTLA